MAGSLTTRLASRVEESPSDTPASSDTREQGDAGAVASPFLMNYDFEQFQVDREVLRDVATAAAAIARFL
jgi:hypothetical protein